MSLDLIPAELLFSFHDAILPWFFILLVVMYWCCHSWNSSFLLNSVLLAFSRRYILCYCYYLGVCEVEPALLFVLLLVSKFLNLYILSDSYNSSCWKSLCRFWGSGLYFVLMVSALLTDCCLFSKYSPSTSPFSHRYTEQHAQRELRGGMGLALSGLGDLLRGYPVVVLSEAHGWNSCWAQSFLTWFAMLTCFFSNIIPLPGSGLIQFLPDSQGLGYFVGSPGSSACTEVFLSCQLHWWAGLLSPLV